MGFNYNYSFMPFNIEDMRMRSTNNLKTNTKEQTSNINLLLEEMYSCIMNFYFTYLYLYHKMQCVLF